MSLIKCQLTSWACRSPGLALTRLAKLATLSFQPKYASRWIKTSPAGPDCGKPCVRRIPPISQDLPEILYKCHSKEVLNGHPLQSTRRSSPPIFRVISAQFPQNNRNHNQWNGQVPDYFRTAKTGAVKTTVKNAWLETSMTEENTIIHFTLSYSSARTGAWHTAENIHRQKSNPLVSRIHRHECMNSVWECRNTQAAWITRSRGKLWI